MALIVVAMLLTEVVELPGHHIGRLVTLTTAAIGAEQAHRTSATAYQVMPFDVRAGPKSAESRRSTSQG